MALIEKDLNESIDKLVGNDENESLLPSDAIQPMMETSDSNSGSGISCNLHFKKPVFIGPRKSKGVGKLKIGKTVGDFENVGDEDGSFEVPESEIKSIYVSDKLTLSGVEPDNEVVKKLPKVSPAQQLNENAIPLPYKEPKWSGLPNVKYSFEVLKNGGIIDTIYLVSKTYFVFGRLGSCDIQMAHPTVSRFHAILQYRKDGSDDAVGFYIYDLGSTHGTYLNKLRIKPNIYVRVHVGHLLKFGGSSRMYILQGPPSDMEQESELTVTELKEKYKEEKLAKELRELKELEEQQIKEEKERNDGIDWGMGEDADEETDLSENPFAAAPNEELYLDDPKKTLRGWFEREGYDLEYNVEEKGFGQFLCRIELPVEHAKGGTIVAEALVKGKKKEAVVQCALEGCRILDRYGLLRQAKHESRKRKAKNWEENDFYDSDEDDFLDRTGAVEKKRQQRMKAAGKIEIQTDTYETLVKKHEEISSNIASIEAHLKELDAPDRKKIDTNEEEDALDAFMSNLSSEIPDNKLINKLKSELVLLKKEELHVKKLVNIACPASLPKLIENPQTASTSLAVPKKKIHIGSHKSIGQSTSSGERKSQPELNTYKSEENFKLVSKEEDEEDEDEEEEEKLQEESSKSSDTDEIDGKHPPNEEVKNTDLHDKEVPGPLATERNNETKNSVPLVVQKSDPDDKLCDSKLIKKDDTTRPSPPPENMVSKQCAVGEKDKIIGPERPPENFVPEEFPGKSKKKQRHRNQRKCAKEYERVSSDPNYSMWVPPEDQTGDGKTKLNERFGY